MRRFLKENSLSLFFLLIFLAALVGQSLAGWQQYNAEQAAESLGRVSWWTYVLSADFAVDVAENWQSEFLQFWVYLAATVWLVQVGSPESKPPDQVGKETEQEQKIGEHADASSPAWARTGGWRTRLYSSSLSWVMGGLFLASWTVQSVGGWAAYNETRLERLQSTISWPAYLTNADFWSRTLQNWQSEFLAVGALAVLASYLRQRGSSQSKPVGAPHHTTGIDG